MVAVNPRVWFKFFENNGFYSLLIRNLRCSILVTPKKHNNSHQTLFVTKKCGFKKNCTFYHAKTWIFHDRATNEHQYLKKNIFHQVTRLRYSELKDYYLFIDSDIEEWIMTWLVPPFETK